MADLSEFEDLDREGELERLLATAQKALRRAKAKSEDLVEATLQGSRDAMTALGPMPKVPRPKPDKGGDPEVALWHLTDWQGSKVSETYNSKVMRERVLRFCDKAERLTEIQRAHHPVNKCVILFGGDMGEGLFMFPSQPFEIDMTIFEQFAYVARLEAEVVRRALAIYDEVEVIEEWGNHGRIGSKRATVPASDNFDRMTYELARAMLSRRGAPDVGRHQPGHPAGADRQLPGAADPRRRDRPQRLRLPDDDGPARRSLAVRRVPVEVSRLLRRPPPQPLRVVAAQRPGVLLPDGGAGV
jgi:hypothetical protein